MRDWLYVDDHVKALTLVVEKGRVGETYNIGGRAPMENIAVVQQICDVLDVLRPRRGSHRNLITHVSDRPGHDRRYAIDPTKIETELGWRAEQTFATGIEATVKWYLDNEWWWRPLRERVYTGTRLGLLPAEVSTLTECCSRGTPCVSGAARRILVIGHNGQVSRSLQETLGAAGHDVIQLGRPEIDLSDPNCDN